jgi:hypothetical protein
MVVQKLEPCLCTVGGNVIWCSNVENSMVLLKKLKITLPCNPAAPLLGIYPEELRSGSYRDICTPLLNSQKVEAAQCALNDECINKI